MGCACALVARGRRLTDVYWSIGVLRAQLSIRVHRPPDWQDRRRQLCSDDTAVLSRINAAMADLLTYGYRRVWALLRRESERDALPVVNAKRVYRIMRAQNLLLERKHAAPRRKRAHKGRVAVAESNRRWCSDGFEFRCDNGEKLRVTFAQDCCDREIIGWAASTGGYDKETVQDVMLGAVEKRFGKQLPTESLAAVMNLAVAFSHYNEYHPHSALEYLSPREFILRKLSQP